MLMLIESTSDAAVLVKYCDSVLFAMLGREHADRLLHRPLQRLILRTGSDDIDSRTGSGSGSKSSSCSGERSNVSK